MRRTFSRVIVLALLLSAALAPPRAFAASAARNGHVGALQVLEQTWEPLARFWRALTHLWPGTWGTGPHSLGGPGSDPNGQALPKNGPGTDPMGQAQPDGGPGIDPNG
jgi:hypothetical protein